MTFIDDDQLFCLAMDTCVEMKSLYSLNVSHHEEVLNQIIKQWIYVGSRERTQRKILTTLAIIIPDLGVVATKQLKFLVGMICELMPFAPQEVYELTSSMVETLWAFMDGYGPGLLAAWAEAWRLNHHPALEAMLTLIGELQFATLESDLGLLSSIDNSIQALVFSVDRC